MLRVRFEVEPAAALLQSLADRLASSDDLLAPAVLVVARALERNFDEEGRPLPWPALSPRYALFKERHFGPGLRILERTGRLRRSIVTRIEAGSLVASTDLPYAAAHQFGLPRRRLPARPFLVLTDPDVEEAAQAIADSLAPTRNQVTPTPPQP